MDRGRCAQILRPALSIPNPSDETAEALKWFERVALEWEEASAGVRSARTALEEARLDDRRRVAAQAGTSKRLADPAKGERAASKALEDATTHLRGTDDALEDAERNVTSLIERDRGDWLSSLRETETECGDRYLASLDAVRIVAAELVLLKGASAWLESFSAGAALGGNFARAMRGRLEAKIGSRAEPVTVSELLDVAASAIEPELPVAVARH